MNENKSWFFEKMSEINNALKMADFFKKNRGDKLPILGVNIVYYRCHRH